MRVGLNATCFNDRPSGAKQRFLGIYGALIDRQPDTEFIIYEPSDCRVGDWFADRPNVSIRRTPVPSAGRLKKAIAAAGFWKRQLRSDRLDLLEAFNLPLVAAPDCPTILTVHDIRQVQRDVSAPLRAFNGAVWRSALSRADRVIAVSDTIRADILAFHPAARVTRVYNGIDPQPFAEAEAALAPATLPTGFMLSVGHFEARKNYPRLIAAVALLRDRGERVPLVIVGNDGGGRAEVTAAIAAHALTGQVTLLSNIGDADLRAIYRAARLVVFPSTYEGFGIPVLEAMAARRPLVTSDIPVFRELTEGRVAYFPPDDPAAMADAIGRVLADPGLAEALIGYGTRRIADFGFDGLAAEIAQIHRATLRTD